MDMMEVVISYESFIPDSFKWAYEGLCWFDIFT